MEIGNRKFHNFIWSLVLCICIVSGAIAPAYAAPTTIDQWAQYDGTGWSYNSSSGTFSWNTNMANSSEFVILSYLRDLYSSIKTYNDNLKSGWLITSSSYSYPSGWSGSFYKAIIDAVRFVDGNIVNNFSSNLQSYTPYPLYSYKNFIDSNLYSNQSFSTGGFINNFFSAMSALNTNMSYIANQFYADNTSGSYNARSLLNQALHKYVDSSTFDYTTILNNIKSNTDNLPGIKTDTSYLSGIKSDTSNLSAILTGVTDFKTANHTDITSVKTSIDNFKTANHTDITSFQNDFNKVTWSTVNLYVLGYYKTIGGEAISSQTASNEWYIRLSAVNWGNGVYKISIPLFMGGLYNNPMNIELGFVYNGVFEKYDDVIYSYDQVTNMTDIYFTIDSKFYVTSDLYYLHITSNRAQLFINPSGSVSSFGILPNDIDFYTVDDNMISKNILKLFKQAKEIFFDDATLAAKKANQPNENSFLNGFTGSGSASASPSDFGAVKDSIVDFKAGFSGGASSSDTFSFMSGDSNAWDWFTQETANDLDRSQGSNTRLLRSSSDVAYDTPLLDSYYNSILSILGGE